MPLINIVQNKKFQSDTCRRKRVSVKFFVFDKDKNVDWTKGIRHETDKLRYFPSFFRPFWLPGGFVKNKIKFR